MVIAGVEAKITIPERLFEDVFRDGADLIAVDVDGPLRALEVNTEPAGAAGQVHAVS